MASAFVNTSARQVGAPRKSEVRDQKLMLRVELPVGAAFPDLPVPGVVPGSLSKVSRDLAL